MLHTAWFLDLNTEYHFCLVFVLPAALCGHYVGIFPLADARAKIGLARETMFVCYQQVVSYFPSTYSDRGRIQELNGAANPAVYQCFDLLIYYNAIASERSGMECARDESCSSLIQYSYIVTDMYMYRATKKVSCSECSLSSLSLSSAGATRRLDSVVSIVVVVASTGLPTDYASGSNDTFYALQEGVRSSNLHNAFGTSGSCRYERVDHKCPLVTLPVNCILWIIPITGICGAKLQSYS